MEEISFFKLLPVIEALRPEKPKSQAFVCDKDTFSKIYHLEKCRQGSEWNTSYLSHIKIECKNNDKLDFKKIDSQFMDIIKKRIRSGDVLCHWSKKHFITLLYNIKETEIRKVQQRIKYFYYSNCNFSEIKLNFRHHKVR